MTQVGLTKEVGERGSTQLVSREKVYRVVEVGSHDRIDRTARAMAQGESSYLGGRIGAATAV